MKKTIFAGALLMISLAWSAAEFRVAAPGKNAGDPQIVATSVADALNAAKRYRAGHPGEPIKIIFDSGVYPLSETIYLAPELSHLTLAAAPGANVVFEGGKQLFCKETRQLNGRRVLVFDVPQDAVVQGFLDQFYVNGRRAEAARTPKSLIGMQHPEKMLSLALSKTQNEDSYKDGYVYFDGDFDPSWHNVSGIDLFLLSAWRAVHLPIRQVIPSERKIVLSKPMRSWAHPSQTCAVWRNVREALTEKGEYYFDNGKMEVYYIPRDGETAENVTASVSVNSLLLLAAGDEKSGQKIVDVTIDGITFCHGGAGRCELENVYRFPGAEKLPVLHNEFFRFSKPTQAAAFAPGVISFQNAEHCRVVNCEVRNSNFYGIGALAGVHDFEIRDCRIFDMGAGGIVVNGVNFERARQDAHLLTENITIVNNHIHDCGKFDFEAVGILIGFARGTLVEHNLIHDLYYTGISAGWNWGYAPATGGENRIGFNHIYNIGKKVMSDMGGIYLMGVQPGTRVYNNLVHDVSSRYYGGWALYADAGSSNQIWERNVCYDCDCNAFHQNYGRENTVRDNVFAFCGEELLRISLCEASMRRGYRFPGLNYTHDFNLYRNVLLSDGKPFFRASYLENFEAKNLFCDCNLYFDLKNSADTSLIAVKLLRADKTLPGAETIVRDDLAAWRKKGHDRHSVFTDPGFVDAQKRDFHVKPDSALLKHGFFDPAETLDRAGLLRK